MEIDRQLEDLQKEIIEQTSHWCVCPIPDVRLPDNS